MKIKCKKCHLNKLSEQYKIKINKLIDMITNHLYQDAVKKKENYDKNSKDTRGKYQVE